MSEATAIVAAFAKQRVRSKFVCTVSLRSLQLAEHDKELANVYEEADLVLASSPSVIWLARVAGRSTLECISVKDLMQQVGHVSAEGDCGVYLLGGKPGSSIRTTDALRRVHPGANIVGQYCPSDALFDTFDEQMKIKALIRRAAPDILLVAFESPLQEKWIRTNLLELNVPVAIGVGNAFDTMEKTSRSIEGCIDGIQFFVRTALSMSFQRIIALIRSDD